MGTLEPKQQEVLKELANKTQNLSKELTQALTTGFPNTEIVEVVIDLKYQLDAAVKRFKNIIAEA